MTVAASPKPSEAPKPAIVWYVVPPLIVALLAASAGRACTATASVAATTTAAVVRVMSRLLVLTGNMTTSCNSLGV